MIKGNILEHAGAMGCKSVVELGFAPRDTAVLHEHKVV